MRRLERISWPLLKLRRQLLLSYLSLILAPVVVLSLVVHNVAEQGITVLVTQEAQRRAEGLSSMFAGYYAVNGSWAGVETLFDELRPRQNPSRPPRNERPPVNPSDNNASGGAVASANAPPDGAAGAADGAAEGVENGTPNDAPPPGRPFAQPEQILITDTSGKVVVSDNSSAVGRVLSADALSHGAVLTANGQQIGTLVVGAALGILDAQEKQLLSAVSSALLLTGLLTSLAAVVLAIWFSGLLTAPVRSLMSGVNQLASGKWSDPVAVHSRNEFADLTRAFNAMAEQLTRQQQQQRQMVADIAHDLRTPLSVMALEVEGIRVGLQSPEEATRSLQEEIDWLQRLIDDLHTLSLLDTGQFTLHVDPTALTPYLCGLCDQWQAMAVKQDKTLICNVADDLPVVQVDPFRMRQVFGNLLNNALQHTPSGTQIRLQAGVRGDQVEISVADTGPGIAPDDLPHLFDRFYRADPARNRGGHLHGSGLGLSIAYQLVALHNGILSVESQPGSGATFRIRLPIRG